MGLAQEAGATTMLTILFTMLAFSAVYALVAIMLGEHWPAILSALRSGAPARRSGAPAQGSPAKLASRSFRRA